MKNNVMKNVVYVFKDAYKLKFYKLFVFGVLDIILASIIPFIVTALPSFTIYLLQNELTANKILIYLGIYTSVIVVIKFLNSSISMKYLLQLFRVRFKKMGDLQFKTLTTDYENIDCADGKVKLNKANNAVYGSEQNGYTGGIYLTTELIKNILSFIIFMVVSCTLNIYLVLLIIATSIINIVINSYRIKWKKENKHNWDKIDTKFRYLKTQSTDLKNAKDIRLYNIKSWFLKLFDKVIDDRVWWFRKEFNKKLFVDIISVLIFLLQYGAMYSYIFIRVKNGMDVALFVLYIGTTTQLGTVVKNVFDNFINLKENNIYINDYLIYDNMKDKTNRGLSDISCVDKHNTCSVDIKNINYTYKGADKPTIKNINLKINKGEKIAVVGPNGAGKTTLIKILCGLYKPQQGEILINNIDSRKYNLYDYFDKFSVVFQDVFAYAFSIASNVACMDEQYIDYERLNNCIKLSGLEDKINSLEKGVNTILLKELDNNGIELSGGQLQKLMLARALYKDSEIIVLDEPTSALDPIAENEMYQKYSELTDGKTSIFISHRLSSTQFCDRIIFLKDGEIAEIGTHDELLDKNGEYTKMFNSQACYYQEEVI